VLSEFCPDGRYRCGTSDAYIWAKLTLLPEGNMILVGENVLIFPEPACYQCFIIPNETKKTHTCKILLANIFQVYWNVVSDI
jgi:hypothetical protein